MMENLASPMVVKIPEELLQHHGCVPLAVDQNPVRTLDANAAHEPLGATVRSRCPWRDLDSLDEEAERTDPSTQVHIHVACPLGDPHRGRVHSDAQGCVGGCALID